MRDFGACPVDTSHPYFDYDVIPTIFSGRPNSHLLTYKYDGEYVWGVIRQINRYDKPTVMALDAGLVNNSFAIAVVGYDFTQSKVETVCLLEIMAYDGYTVNFEETYKNVILPLATQLNTCLVVADRWNSVDHLHRIKSDRGLRNKRPVTYSKQYSVKPKDFAFVKTLMSNHMITVPPIRKDREKVLMEGQIGDYKKELIEKPVEHFMLQLATVTDYGASLCPGKAEGLTDDLCRAWVLAVSVLNKDTVMDLVKENEKYIRKSSLGIGISILPRI
jgi:hypothetical protein